MIHSHDSDARMGLVDASATDHVPGAGIPSDSPGPDVRPQDQPSTGSSNPPTLTTPTPPMSPRRTGTASIHASSLRLPERRSPSSVSAP